MLFKHFILQYFQDIPPPDFLSRPEDLWTEEEKKVFEEYEKKVKELDEEKEDYRQVNENEEKMVLFTVLMTKASSLSEKQLLKMNANK